MRYACESANHIEDRNLRDQIVSAVDNGIEPFEGYSVAYAFVAIAKWRFADGDHEGAFEYAQKAIDADDTWAEAEFILGWLVLATGQSDSQRHLEKAVEKDRRILFRISNDDLCKQFPHIVKRLKRTYSDAPE